MHEFVVRMQNKIAVKRCFPSDCIFAALDALKTLVANCEEQYESKVELVVVRDAPAAIGHRTPIRFTNICGKIDHVMHSRVYQPGIEPLVVNVKNAFGRFRGLYSKLGNLLTCTSKSSTLFRGGRCSKSIQRMIDHAINPQNIAKTTLHMLVATARLGYGVCIDSYYLEAYMARDSRWTCVPMALNEDMSHVKAMRLTDFDADFMQRLGIPAPQSVVINVSKHGSVNFFMTMAVDVDFVVGVEHTYRAFLNELLHSVYHGS